MSAVKMNVKSEENLKENFQITSSSYMGSSCLINPIILKTIKQKIKFFLAKKREKARKNMAKKRITRKHCLELCDFGG